MSTPAQARTANPRRTTLAHLSKGEGPVLLGREHTATLPGTTANPRRTTV